MELVELLARELVEWPEGVEKVVQNHNRNIEGYGNDCGVVDAVTDCWNGREYTGFNKELGILASDRLTAIVTREMWGLSALN